MAKSPFPGLVILPPSDYHITKQKWNRGVLLVMALVGCWISVRFLVLGPEEACATREDTIATAASHQPCTEQVRVAQTQISADHGLPELHTGLSPRLRSTTISAPPVSVDLSAREPLAPHDNPILRPADPDNSELASIAAPKRIEDARLETAPPPRNDKPLRATAASDPSVSSPPPLGTFSARDDPFALYRLGRVYEKLRQSPSDARTWYLKASPGLHHMAQAGNPQAMYVLGVMYARGRGVRKDLASARYWLTLATDHHVRPAEAVLAQLNRQAARR